MLVGLGFGMIAVFMYLILSKRLTPVVALILVPVAFGILAVQSGAAIVAEGGVADAIMGVAVLRDHLLRVDDRCGFVRPADPVHPAGGG
jgi:Mg2+/citrate symporter